MLGAGLMGAGIGQVSIDKGYKVLMKDMNQQGLSRGIDQIYKGLNSQTKKKKITRSVVDIASFSIGSCRLMDTSSSLMWFQL